MSSLALRKKFAEEATPEAILSGAQNQTMTRLLPLVEAELEVSLSFGAKYEIFVRGPGAHARAERGVWSEGPAMVELGRMNDIIIIASASLIPPHLPVLAQGGCTMLWNIGRHISLLTPAVEDGNNFGVDVQASCLKTVQDKEVRLRCS